MKQDDLILRLGADPDTAARTALEIFESQDVAERMADANLRAAIRASVAGGNHSAAAILLLAYDTSEQARELLAGLRNSFGTELAKLQPWTQVVVVSLPVDVALSWLGDSEARARLFQEIEDGGLESRIFLVSVLREIGSPELLHALSRALDDQRTVSGGVPSGAEPARRLCDAAVDAFVGRLNLNVSFTLNTAGRYSAQQVDEVKRLILESIPQ
jgi:hypothetical protein